MANNVFKGFKQVAPNYDGFESGYLYFVRSNSGATDGYIYFNGKKYGTAKDVEKDIKDILGNVPSGTTVAGYLDALDTAISNLSSALTVETAVRQTVDASLLGDSTGTTKSGATIYDLRRAVDGMTGSTHSHDNYNVLSGISAEKVAAWDAAEQNAKDYADSAITDAVEALDATVSGSSNGVSVEVTEADGVITVVSVTAPNFAETYDALGAAADALADANDYTDSALASAKTYTDEAIAGLDMSAVTVGAGETISSITEADGVVSVTKQNISIVHTQVSDWDTELAKKQDNLAFKTAYDAETNKVVTEADINDLAGAMHFVGVSTTDPASAVTISGYTTPENGDVCIYGVKEYVYANNAWHELGDETLFVTKATTIAGVDLNDNISKSELLTALDVEDGAQVNVIEGVEVNGTAATVSGKTVQITLPSATVSGASEGVSVEVEQVSGSVTTVTVDATAMDTRIDDLEAVSAGTRITALEQVSADTRITDLESVSADTRLQALEDLTATTSSALQGVTNASGDTSLTITSKDQNNVQTLAVNLSSVSGNTLEVKADGLYAAIYYEDLDAE